MVAASLNGCTGGGVDYQAEVWIRADDKRDAGVQHKYMSDEVE